MRSMFAREDAGPQPQVPPGRRVYAVGDIHGRLDLFEALIGAIEQDDFSSGPARSTVILLGDLVDRGPDSAGVLEAARQWRGKREVRILAGNHEEMFLRSFKEVDLFRHFIRHGGRDTILSFGVERGAFASSSIEEAQELMDRAVPGHVREFVASFEDMIEIGDYLFVHAGIEPGLPLAEQSKSNLRWIREPFLSHGESHGPVVVHGHTITEMPEDRGNRIGIDTGAYASGRLTALVLEGSERRYLEAVQDDDGTIRAGTRDQVLK